MARPPKYRILAPTRCTVRTSLKGSLATSTSVTPKYKYVFINDKTLTKAQQKRGGWKTPRSFRDASNKTLGGISTGYHEAFVTTGYFHALHRARVNLHTVSFVPPVKSRKKGSSLVISRDVYDTLMAGADGYRTDTARTFLGAPGGTAAGHSGSNTHVKNQSSAHEVLREMVTEIAEDATRTKPSAMAIHVAGAAVMVWSIAPAELARNGVKDSANLKDQAFLPKYEKSRNEMKGRILALYDTLSTATDKQFVLRHALSVKTKLGGNRMLGDNGQEPVSPWRDESLPPKKVGPAGKGYLNPQSKQQRASLLGSIQDHDIPASVSQPFRADRQP